MVGIYKATNLINGKIYIGQSFQIEKRIKEHIRHSKNTFKSRKKSYFHNAINFYGKENFKFEILEECKIEELDEKEVYYIGLYKSYDKSIGYNMTLGADNKTMMFGENSPVSVLTNKEVEEIRKMYADPNISCSDAYNIFSKKIKKISLNTFKFIWRGGSYKNVMPEVFTKENRLMNRKLGFKKPSSGIKPFVKEIRQRKKKGEQRKIVYEDYNQFSFNVFSNVWRGRTFPEIQP